MATAARVYHQRNSGENPFSWRAAHPSTQSKSGVFLLLLFSFYFLVGGRLGGRCKAQEPSCEGPEDQVEAQRLPKMAARHTGGAHKGWEHKNGCSASQKERRSQGRLTPGSVEHPNERVQTRDVEESAEHGKGVNPTRAYPVVPQCRPEGCQFRPPVEALQFRVSPSDVVAEEHVQEDEGCDEGGKPQQDRSQLQRGSRRHRCAKRGSAPLAERQDSEWREQNCSNRTLDEHRPDHALRQFVCEEGNGFHLTGDGRDAVHAHADSADEHPAMPAGPEDEVGASTANTESKN